MPHGSVCTVAANAWPRPPGDEAEGKLKDCAPAARHSFRRCKEKKKCEARKPQRASAKAQQRLPHRRRRDTPWRSTHAPELPNLGRKPRPKAPVGKGGRRTKRPVETVEQLPHCERWAAVKARVLSKLSANGV